MKTFATLRGTNCRDDRHKVIFTQLVAVAQSAGFEPGDLRLPIRDNQIRLDDWDLEHLGPGSDSAEFFLSVTAPKVPSMSPIPIQQTVRAPLFSVIVMPNFFGIWSENRPQGSVTEANDAIEVEVQFTQFLSRLRSGEDQEANKRSVEHDEDGKASPAIS